MEASTFDGAFEEALDTSYTQFGVGATYTPSGGSAVSVTLLIDERSRRSSDKTGTRSLVHVLRASVRVSEVESLSRGDTFSLDGETTEFKVTPSSASSDGLEWDFEATAEVMTQIGHVEVKPDT